MSGGGYEVDHEKVTAAGKQVKQHSQQLDHIKAEVREAEVPTKAWGLLGIELGLYSAYVSMLTDLESHLHMSQDHIDTLGEALNDTAKMYRESEKALADVFNGIKADTEEFGRNHPDIARGAVADAGSEGTV